MQFFKVRTSNKLSAFAFCHDIKSNELFVRLYRLSPLSDADCECEYRASDDALCGMIDGHVPQSTSSSSAQAVETAGALGWRTCIHAKSSRVRSQHFDVEPKAKPVYWADV